VGQYLNLVVSKPGEYSEESRITSAVTLSQIRNGVFFKSCETAYSFWYMWMSSHAYERVNLYTGPMEIPAITTKHYTPYQNSNHGCESYYSVEYTKRIWRPNT